MFPALIMNTLLLPFRWIVNFIRSLIYDARGAIDTTGKYVSRDSRDDRIMILEVNHDGRIYRVRLYAEFDNQSKALSQLVPGDSVPVRWIPGAGWSMGRKV